MKEHQERRTHALIVPALLVLIVVLGAGLRLQDPLSSPAMGAEDPYTHVVFTKEHLRRGYFDDATVLGTSLYPPGLHAFSAAFAPLAGVDLYDWARFSPAAFGALSILGVGLLAQRLGGPVAGIAAALVVAVIPEHIVRTNLFFPTMVDMALLPAFFLLFLFAARGSRGATLMLLMVAVALAYTHPWVVPLAAGIAALYVGLRVLRGQPFEAQADEPLEESGKQRARRLARPAALLTLAVAVGAVTRWDHGNTGFVSFLQDAGPLSALAALRLPDPLLFVVLVALVGAVAAAAVALAAFASGAFQRIPRRGRMIGGWALGALAIGGVWQLAQDPPVHVGYSEMLAPVPIALALLGVLLAFGRPTPLGDMGISLAGVMFPLTAIQVFVTVFDAEHWPSRAVVYLSLGVALLAAVSVAYAAQEALRLVSQRRTTRWAAPTAALVAVSVMSGAFAVAPETADPWYRLYEAEEFEGFERTAMIMNDDPDVRVVVPGWQAGLVLKALSDPFQVRHGPRFFNDTENRQAIIDEDPHDDLYVLVDHFLLDRIENEPERGFDVSFLEGPDYRLVLRTSDDQYRLYRYMGSD